MSLITTLVSFVTFAAAPASDGMHCVFTGEAFDKAVETIDYKGVRYGTCCAGCGASFIATPDKVLAEDVKKNVLVGVSLFDPVSGARIEAKAGAPNSVFKGVKYVFANADEKSTFDKSPAKFTASPAKEVLHCPVENEDIASYAMAGGYVDAGGVRYYVCCAGCLGAMQKDASQYTAKVAKFVKAAAPESVKAK